VPLDEVLHEFHSTLDPPNGDHHGAMAAKERLRVRVEEPTETEAEATLDFIARGRDDFARWLDSRPEDDEPLTDEERAALAESDADIAAGRTISLDQLKRALRFTRSAEKELRRLDPPVRTRVLAALERLPWGYVCATSRPAHQYVVRRQAVEQEVERIGPPADPEIAQAEALPDDFARFWEIEEKPAERHKLLGQLFDRVWQDGGRSLPSSPAPFARYVQAADTAGCNERERRDSNPGGDTQIEIRL
jgi:hypothetical protein